MRENAPRAPPVKKFDRLYKLKGYKYSIRELTETLREFPQPEFAAVRRANLADTLRRQVYGWSIREWSVVMTEVARNGGFERADDLAFALRAFRRYLADFEYFGRCTLEGPLQKRDYVNVLAVLAKDFLEKFRGDQRCAELARETFNRSLPFWRQCGAEFEFHTFLWLANIVVRLAKHFDALSDVQFLQERLKGGLAFFDEPAVEAKDLRNIIELDASLRVLEAPRAKKLKERLEQMEKSAA